MGDSLSNYRFVMQKVMESRKPITFCAERGIYPEMIGTSYDLFIIRRSLTVSASRLGPLFGSHHGGPLIARFLNSGCIAGPLEQVRMLRYPQG